MSQRNCGRGFTLVELLAVLAILAIVVALLVPAILKTREAARCATCSGRLCQLAMAFSNFESTNKHLPPSSGVTKDATGKITAIDGWSFYVPLLPHLELNTLYGTLNAANGRPLIEPVGAEGTPHATALATSFHQFLCPSSGVGPFVDSQTKMEAITNYKALGATHIESLSVASADAQKPKYKPDIADAHPDGVCFPGSSSTTRGLRDGRSNTILVVETTEPRFARWTVGAEATLVGLPSNIEYERPANANYFAPKGFDFESAQNGKSKIDPTYRTYLAWDYEKKPYDGGDGTKGGKYGPSSRHPGVVNHAFLDGSVHSIVRDVDVALYMFIITRDGGDPANLFWEQQGR
jgi:prepilin-type N-terminal cleavage/methylation domain-containing protein